MEIFIEHKAYAHSIGIYMIKYIHGVRHIAKPVKVIWKESKEGFIMEPLLELVGGDSRNFLQAMAEALDKDGIKTDNDAKIAGKLEAVNNHLQDMRSLVFKKTKVILKETIKHRK